MGQRLVINVKNNDDTFASIYYHWSACSVSALCEANRLLKNFFSEDFMQIEDESLRLIRIVESGGGVIYGGKGSKEYLEILKRYPEEKFRETGNRNEGLIALTQRGREDINHWAEGFLNISLNNQTLEDNVSCFYANIDELRAIYDEDEDIEDNLKNMIQTDINFSNIRFFELDKAIEVLSNAERLVELPTGEILEIVK